MLDNGEVLTEGAAILQYLADLVPEKQLAPKAGTMERYRLMEALNYIATELHKSFVPIFNPAYEGAKEAAKNKLTVEFDYVDRLLTQKPYWMGEQFTVAERICLPSPAGSKRLDWISDNGKHWTNTVRKSPRVRALKKCWQKKECDGFFPEWKKGGYISEPPFSVSKCGIGNRCWVPLM